MHPFIYLRPRTLAEALATLAEHPDAKAMSGGMTLLPTLKQRLDMPSHLVDLMHLPELQGISDEGSMLRIGAATRHQLVASSPIVRAGIPALADLAELIGDQQVRNRGTIGGSVANSDPGADYPSAIVGLDATVITTARRIAADDFFIGMFETALQAGELIVGFELPKPVRCAYRKQRHPASGYAVVGVFVAETSAGVRVAITGAGPSAFRWTEAEARLSGSMSPSSLEGLALAPDLLNDDLSASAPYRAHLAITLLRRAVASLAVGVPS